MIFEKSKIFGKIDVLIEEVDDCVNCANKHKCALISALQEKIVYSDEYFYVEKCPQFSQGGLRRVK